MKQTTNQSQTNTQEKKEENFFKKHWKKIVVTTVVVCGVTVSVILLYKNGDKITKLFEYKHSKVKTSSTINKVQQLKADPISSVVEEDPIELIKETVEKTVNVSSYVRKLPNGKRISQQKKEQMLSLDLYIDDNHTYCNEYTRKIKASAA